MKNLFPRTLTVLCWMVVASALLLSSCSKDLEGLGGDGFITNGGGTATDTIVKTDTVHSTDSLFYEKNIIDAVNNSCQFVSYRETQDTVVKGELRLTKPADMNLNVTVSYKMADREQDSTSDKNYNATNIVKINNYETMHLNSLDSLKTVSMSKGMFKVGDWVIPISIENKTDVFTFGPRTFTAEDGSLCTVDVVDATLSFGKPVLVEGTTATYKVAQIYTFTMSEGGEWKYILDDCIVTLSDKDEVVYTIENIIENKNGQISFEVVEKHTINTELDVRVPMSFFREIKIAAGNKISREEETKDISLNAYSSSDWVYVSKFNQGTISGQTMEQDNTYSFAIASGVIEVPVELTTVRNITVEYKGQTLEVPLSDPSANMLSLEEASSKEEKYFDIFSFEALFCAVVNGTNSNITAVQEIELSVKKKDTVLRLTFINDEFEKRGAELFSLINYQTEYTVSDPVNGSCDLNRNLKITDNGKITTNVDATTLENGSTNTVKVSDIKSDTTSGERTTTVYTATFGGKAVEVRFSVDSKMSWRGNALQDAIPTLTKTEAVKTGERMDGIYLVKTYDLVTTWSVGGETFENHQEAEVKLIAMEPTFPGYEIFSVQKTLDFGKGTVNRLPNNAKLFWSIRTRKVGEKSNTPKENRCYLVEVSKFNEAFEATHDVKKALEQVAIVKDNVNLEGVEILAAVYGASDPNSWEFAILRAIRGSNFMTPNGWWNGWQYESLETPGHIHGFGTESANIQSYDNPFQGNVDLIDGLYYQDGNLVLLSDK